VKQICILLMAFILLFFNGTSAAAAEDVPLFRFTCVSDLHLDDILIQGTHKNRSQFQDLLRSSYEKGYSDLFICNGDISSYGDTDVWEDAQEYVSAAGFEATLWTLGNHAYGTVLENPNAAEDFKKFIGEDSIYYHRVINGYHFICMAAEKNDLYVVAGADVYSDTQVQWLSQEIALAAADSDGKPIFVLSHYPMGRNGVADALIPILEQYQNVFFFWGHEHGDEWEDYSLDDYVRTDQGFVNAHTGCLQYGYTNLADALLVDVYADRVVLTYDRTDGAVLSPNTLSTWLTSWTASFEDNSLSWCVPPVEDIQLIVCSYDTVGQMTSLRQITPTPCQRQTFEVTSSPGSTRIFYVDSQYAPLHETQEFSRRIIFGSYA